MRRLVVGTLLAVLLVACSDDSREKASFAALSASDREDMTAGSMGTFEASLVFAITLATPSTGCPSISIAGTTVTVNGGCTDEEGVAWKGKLVAATNSAGLSIEADSFTLTQEDSVVSVDGKITSNASGIHSDVVLSFPARELSIDASWSSSGNSTRIDSDSSVELVGSGYADSSGQYDLDAPSGAIELKGEDTFRVDFATYANGCAAATLDGAAAGTVCVEGSLARPSSLSFFRSALARGLR